MRTVPYIVLCLFTMVGCQSTREVAFSESSKSIVNSQVVESASLEPKQQEVLVRQEDMNSISTANLTLPSEIYYVIAGRFKIHANAQKFQKQLMNDGFHSQLLQNQQGLYRVSMKSSDILEDVRSEVFRIRKSYKRYGDVWLLRSSAY
jgi:Sporulation related domain.